MRKTVLALSALAAAVIIASANNRAEASPPGHPGALTGAVDELAVVDSVHCRPGWRHHNPNRWRRADGCSREYRRGVVVVPGRERFIWRDGVRVRVGGGSRERSRTTVRSRTDINVRTRSGRDGGDRGDRARIRTGGGGDGGKAGMRSGGGGGDRTVGGGGGQRSGGQKGGAAKQGGGGGAGQGGGGGGAGGGGGQSQGGSQQQ